VLAKSKRLNLTRKEEIFEKGKRVGSPLLFLFFEKRDDSKTKIALVAGKKIDKRAVVRNRIKRLMAEGIREYWGGLRGGYNMVLVARGAILKKELVEIKNEIGRLLGKGGLLKEND